MDTYRELDTAKKSPDLRVLQVIHGFPPYYMAGSEVYTYKLTKALASLPGTEVSVFSRVEDPYPTPYSMRREDFDGIPVYRIVKGSRDYLFEDKYLDPRVDDAFRKFLAEIHPDIVHIGHLSHLSTNLVAIAKAAKIPVVFTLHDYWMQCLRGQLITSKMQLCPGPSEDRCVTCMRYYFRSAKEAREHYRQWDAHARAICAQVDHFIAPCRFLQKKFEEWGIPADRISYLDYGFDGTPFQNFKKESSPKIRFGFTGRIIPVKGVDLLIEAINGLDPSLVELNIFGASNSETPYLKRLVKNGNVKFLGDYDNRDIADVFQEIDVLIVPSRWYENSPLVIHEAFLAGVPIITANIGGMAELVKDGENGLLFQVNDPKDLQAKMQRFLDHPELLHTLTKPVTPVRSIQEDAQDILAIYRKVLGRP